MQILFELQQFSHQYLISVYRSNPGYHFAIYHVSLVSVLKQFPFHTFFLFFMTLILFKSNKQWGILWKILLFFFFFCFLMIRLGVWVWEWRPQKMCYSHHILPGNYWYQHDITNDIKLNKGSVCLYSPLWRSYFYFFCTLFFEYESLSLPLSYWWRRVWEGRY